MNVHTTCLRKEMTRMTQTRIIVLVTVAKVQCYYRQLCCNRCEFL